MKSLKIFLKHKVRRWSTPYLIQKMFIVLVIWLCILYTQVKLRDYRTYKKIRAIKQARISTKQQQLQPSILKLRKLIGGLNEAEHIHNVENFGLMSRKATIFLVMVNDNIQYLKHLMYSLSKVNGIDKSLIVLSHSYYDEKINEFVKSVDFSLVLQIFFPYSLQLYPNAFPGPNEDDCPEFLDVDIAIEINCTGAYNPDIKGNFRNSDYVERKLHWWWSANTIFEELGCTLEHKGLVVFLDDYNYLSEDFLYTINYMKKTASANFSYNELFGFGGFSSSLGYEDQYRVNLRVWDPTYFSQAIAFNISMWKSISAQYDSFCEIDDYTWKRSLYYISLNRRDGKRFRAFSSAFPRAFDIRECNVSSEWRVTESCNITENVATIKRFLKDNSQYMNPSRLDVFVTIELPSADDTIIEYVNNNGGWNDPRDKEFCRNITVNTGNKIDLDQKIYDFNLFTT